MRLLAVVLVLGALQGSSASGAVHVFRFVDHTRVARFRTGAVAARTLVTYVRVPTHGRPPYPLIVFGHGFAVTPGLYAPLLAAWARAGFVVAAPLFPVENANAPGGPDERDLVNQPGDVRFVITQLLAAAGRARSPLFRRIDPRRIAVAGQSDGGETAFAVGYERSYLDRRIRACIVLSGAALPGEPLSSARRAPPLLAVQGTADTVNPPALTRDLFREAERPKFLLELLGAGHLPPYSTDRRRLPVVERVTIAFLDAYLRHGTLQALTRAADVPGTARFVADP
jgi:predicted dienelactone hydrolase